MSTLTVLSQSVTIHDAREAYNNYRLMFQKEADQAKLAFYELYHQQNTSLDDVIKLVPKQAEQAIEPAIKLCINILMQHNVLKIDENRFKEEYSAYQDIWGEPFLKVYDRYAEIVMDQKNLDDYRVARRQGRTRWQGGGFGLSGALKGAATAGALNIVSGAGHMLANGVGKITSSIGASMEKSRIFKDEKTYSSIVQGVWDAVFWLHVALIDCLSKTQADPLPLSGMVSAEDVRAAEAILNNAQLVQDEKQCHDMLLQSFQLNPYQKDWYRFALQQFGDHDGTLGEVEAHFGLSVVSQVKEAQIEAFAKSLPLDTEEHAQSAAEQVNQLKKKLHFSGETSQTKVIHSTVKRFDKEYRTVDGIELATRAEAEIAREELSAIIKIEEAIDYGSLSSIAEGEQKISGYSSIVAQRHQKMLREKWVSLDKNLRTVQPSLSGVKSILSDSADAAAVMRELDGKWYQQLTAAVSSPDAETALQELVRVLNQDSGHDELQKLYLTAAAKELARIDLELRTAHGKEYPSREAAQAADRLYNKLRTDFFASNIQKHAEQFRERIGTADLSDAAKKELLDELFQLENAKEIKTARIFSNITAVALLIIIVGSYIFHLTGTSAFAAKNVVVLDVSLMVKDVQVVDRLTFADGLKNGVVVFGRCIGDMFVEGFFDYIGGFNRGLIGNLLWAVLGIFWIILRQMIVVIPRYVVSFFMTLTQSAPFPYYIGYLIGTAIPFAVCQLSFSEDEQEENVKRIKGWTVKKVFTVILIVLLITVISIYFIWSGQ